MATPPHHRSSRNPAAPWPPAPAAGAAVVESSPSPAEAKGARAAAPVSHLAQGGHIFDSAESAALAGRLAELRAELDQLLDEVDGLVQRRPPGPF